jgi:holliday junction DNA helicase RuvA
MINYLKGNIIKKTQESLIIDIGGIGYKVYVPELILVRFIEGDQIELFTYQSFSDHGSSLFGFLDITQLSFFEKIIQVSGIGPRLGMTIMESPLDTIKHAILNHDIALLIEFPGIGRKTAERLCLELKNKIVDHISYTKKSELTEDDNSTDTNSPNQIKTHTTPLCNEEAFMALQSLGYSRLEAHRMISKVPSTTYKTEDIVKQALKKN